MFGLEQKFVSGRKRLVEKEKGVQVESVKEVGKNLLAEDKIRYILDSLETIIEERGLDRKIVVRNLSDSWGDSVYFEFGGKDFDDIPPSIITIEKHGDKFKISLAVEGYLSVEGYWNNYSDASIVFDFSNFVRDPDFYWDSFFEHSFSYVKNMIHQETKHLQFLLDSVNF